MKYFCFPQQFLIGIQNFGSLWQERETQRKEGQLDDLLVIDGRPFNEDSDQILQPSQLRTTSMAPSIDYDSRVDWFRAQILEIKLPIRSFLRSTSMALCIDYDNQVDWFRVKILTQPCYFTLTWIKLLPNSVSATNHQVSLNILHLKVAKILFCKNNQCNQSLQWLLSNTDFTSDFFSIAIFGA